MRTKLGIILSLMLLLAACEADSPSIQGDILFQEQFVAGQTGNWLLEADETSRATVVAEQLLIEVEAPKLLHFTTLEAPSFSDFVMEVDVMQLAGNPESSFGILFRIQSPDQFYRFDITGNGMYMIEKHNADGTWTRFVEDWTESAALNQGLRATNRLRVMAIGPNLSFFANDNLLLEGSDSSYAGGRIALDAGTFGQAGLQVAFDNVVVKQP